MKTTVRIGNIKEDRTDWDSYYDKWQVLDENGGAMPLRCEECIHVKEHCLPVDVYQHQPDFKVRETLYSNRHICKNFKPKSIGTLKKMWAGVEKYKEYLHYFLKDNTRGKIGFEQNYNYYYEPLQVILIQDNTRYVINLYDWFVQDYTDENGKITKWMKREELDGRFQLCRESHYTDGKWELGRRSSINDVRCINENNLKWAEFSVGDIIEFPVYNERKIGEVKFINPYEYTIESESKLYYSRLAWKVQYDSREESTV